MMIPLVVLALGAAAAGLLNVPGHWLADFLGHSPSFRMGHFYASGVYGWDHLDPAMFGQHAPADADAHGAAHTTIMVVSILSSFLGVALAYLLHLKDRARAERLAAGAPGLTRLLEARYWVDEIYQAGIVEPLRSLGRAFFLIDRFVVDGLVWAVSFVPMLGGFALKLTTQRGYLQGYAVVMLLGIAVILMVIFL